MNIILQKLSSYRTILLLIIGAGSTMYCTSQQKSIQSTNVNNELPEWVTHPSKAFSERTYLMAVGSGDNLADARARKKKQLEELSKIRKRNELIAALIIGALVFGGGSYAAVYFFVQTVG